MSQILENIELMDKIQVINEIGRLEGQLSRFEIRLSEYERDLFSANGNYTVSGFGLIIGVILLLINQLFATFFIIVSVLALIYAGFKSFIVRKFARENLESTEDEIAETRSKLARLRAYLSTLN